ncbi:chemotaxis protein CheA [Motiliproteus sp. SC1-56]|uniref:chemotaxis protein CheA n=1 Tax=Motiliproteus sp. SC1-56 TaxID=2799565 RepID=UPI001A8EDBE5|nr:chemotaxis protein CheA [Motiliproteus sp. SC1-56]
MDLMEQAQETFVTESLDLLIAMEEGLNQLESEPDNEELINSVFRAAHTIKGSAGLFGLDDIVAFTHKVENVLDRVRDGDIAITPPLIAILLECRDHTEALIEDMGGEATDPALLEQSGQLLERLQGVAGGPGGASPAAGAEAAASSPSTWEASVDRQESPPVENDNWHISLKFHPDVFRNGMDPLSFLRYLATLGEIVRVATSLDAMPEAEAMDPESCYLGMEVAFKSDADKQTIMEVFDFIAEDSEVAVLPPYSKLSEYAELIEKLKAQDDSYRIGDLLLQCGALTQPELDKALSYQQAHRSDPEPQPLGEVLVEQRAVHPETVKAALGKQKQIKEVKLKESKSIRVDAGRLDQLINLVGELVIAGAGTNLKAQQLGDADLQESVSLISRLVEEIRDRSLRLRMVQVGDTFNRFNRVVRDVSRELGKSIRLVIEGSETELDKSVVEKIGDPLTHLVRNAIDHGIESAEARRAAGKPEQGMVKLDAYHDSGSIVIEVSDDGGGIDADKVLAKARANGLVPADAQLSRPEILRLILKAGLSTKEAVSNLSGRGVGMDVVTKNVEALRGDIEVESELGRGTSIKVRLPLTLSIIDGFLVGVGSAGYVIPLDSVVECIEHQDVDKVRAHGGRYINLRDEVLPYLNLRELFGERGASTVGRENIVVVRSGNQKAGLVVDELMGEYQTVIKPLSRIFSRLSGISGSTILGSGEVAMILDVSALIKEAEQKTLQLG